ncbi:hypothetical protein I3842_08G083500 [Carya illinoinensis]|uniref:Anticodon-binding domain-containing protein n=2 Tax=Carya illinoinensis TaxID=32201 RepID=A0A922EA94_CARIL|nr:hypothetical protein I3842_08G083500 [Carya illinoinensis]
MQLYFLPFLLFHFSPSHAYSFFIQENMANDDVKKFNANASGGGKKKEVKKETGLGITNCKDENFGEWYSEVVVNGELIEYYDISGCFILIPWAMSIWETMQKLFDAEIKKMNIQNCYFPLFVSPGVLQKEKDHVEGFAPEAFILNNGRGIQGATSHCLGQNFAKMFETNFENEKGEKGMVWQNSWAYSTRTIGVMVMVHGDDKGLVLPPKVATVQVIIIPVPYKDADTRGIFDACASTVDILSGAGIRAKADFRDNYSPGWKYSHWEMKGTSCSS